MGIIAVIIGVLVAILVRAGGNGTGGNSSGGSQPGKYGDSGKCNGVPSLRRDSAQNTYTTRLKK